MAYTAIDRSRDHFVVTLWTGNDVDGRTISNGEFLPDFLWMFNRNNAGACPGVVYNSTIGAGTNSAAFGGNANGQYNAIFTSLNYELLSKAMQDVFSEKPLTVNDEDAGKTIGQFLQQISKQKYAVEQEASAKFLEEKKKNPNIISLTSGLQYEVITMGTGEKPKATDEVTVHYRGSLVNGKQFDSSYDRNEPLKLPLNNVIPGWTEGVQLMPVGSKFKFYIPYQLGYGERGAGQDIPTYSTLIFDIE